MSNLALFDLEEPDHIEGRDPLDRYYTPEWATQALVDYLGERLVGDVWDPCCGKDWGGRVFRKAAGVNTYLGTDIDPAAVKGWWIKGVRDELTGCHDFLHSHSIWGFLLSGWIITNPPYRVGNLTAADFVRRALHSGGRSVAMLLTLRWLEACEDRADLLIDNPPTDILIIGRVQFIGSGKGNTLPSVWFVWDENRQGEPTRIQWHRRSA